MTKQAIEENYRIIEAIDAILAQGPSKEEMTEEGLRRSHALIRAGVDAHKAVMAKLSMLRAEKELEKDRAGSQEWLQHKQEEWLILRRDEFEVLMQGGTVDVLVEPFLDGHYHDRNLVCDTVECGYNDDGMTVKIKWLRKK